MENGALLVEKILSDARNKADGIIRDAAQKADVMIRDAEDKAKETIESGEDTAKVASENLITRSRTVQYLDSKKLMQSKKLEITKACFDEAKKSVISLNDSEYKKYIAALIKKYGEDKDTVIISSNDKDRLDAEFIAKVAKDAKIKLTLAKKTGDFLGGIILSNGNVDKNLSIEMLTSELESSSVQGKVIEILGL